MVNAVGSGFESELRRFCAEFACSPRVRMGRLIGDSKLPVGVNVSVNGCSSLYVSPVMNWDLSRVNPAFAL